MDVLREKIRKTGPIHWKMMIGKKLKEKGATVPVVKIILVGVCILLSCSCENKNAQLKESSKSSAPDVSSQKTELSKDFSSDSEKGDSQKRSVYRKKIRQWFLQSSGKESRFANILAKCPTSVNGCVVEKLSIRSREDVPLGSALIPPDSFVRVPLFKDKSVSLNLKVRAMGGEPNCGGVYDYGTVARVGRDLILTNKGPVSAQGTFKHYEVLFSHKEVGFQSQITGTVQREVLLEGDGMKIDPKSYFVKNGRLAKKSNAKCISIGEYFGEATWCKEKFGFQKSRSPESDKETEEYETKDREYQLRVSYTPSC